VVGNGISLSWRTINSGISNGTDVITRYNFFKSDNGLAHTLTRKPNFASILHQVSIFTTTLAPTYSHGYQLQLNQTLPWQSDENDCIQKQFVALIPVNGILTKTPL